MSYLCISFLCGGSRTASSYDGGGAAAPSNPMLLYPATVSIFSTGGAEGAVGTALGLSSTSWSGTLPVQDGPAFAGGPGGLRM